MPDETLSAELETALLRQLAATWDNLNQTYFRGALRPPTLRLADGAHRLGQWLPEERAILLNRSMVLGGSWGAVVEVLKHELAHQFVTEVLGEPNETAHGPAFAALCARHGIDAAASGLPTAPDPAGERVLGRVAKLLALADSPNAHEAELAMAEAQRLMLKHNIDATRASPYTFRHLGTPTGRLSPHERVLGGLLNDHFFVQCIWVPVWRPLEGKRGQVLEACGTSVNLAIAEHTHAFLLHTAERLWDDYRRRQKTGNRDRRTFLTGVMSGFREKLDAQRQRHAAEGLVWVGDGELQRYYRRRHPHIRSVSHSGVERNEAHAEGRAAGRDIVLRRVVGERVERGRLLPERR